MPDSLFNSFSDEVPADPQAVAIRLLLALVLGGGVAALYRRTRHDSEILASFPTTLLLLCVLIAVVTQVIGDNVARAFSLVGALSIVRFRTVVRDTQDTAFVILAVVTGMAVGAHNLWVAIVGLGVVAFAAMWSRWRSRPDTSPIFLLTLRLSLGRDPDSTVGATLEHYLLRRELMSLGTARQGVAMEYVYETRLRPEASPDKLLHALNHAEGVQSVVLRRRDFDRD